MYAVLTSPALKLLLVPPWLPREYCDGLRSRMMLRGLCAADYSRKG